MIFFDKKQTNKHKMLRLTEILRESDASSTSGKKHSQVEQRVTCKGLNELTLKTRLVLKIQ